MHTDKMYIFALPLPTILSHRLLSTVLQASVPPTAEPFRLPLLRSGMDCLPDNVVPASSIISKLLLQRSSVVSTVVELVVVLIST